MSDSAPATAKRARRATWHSPEVHVPESLAWLAREADGARWLDALPSLVSQIRNLWGLGVDESAAFEGAQVSWVAPARRDGVDLVLKVQWPHRECEHEATALRAWGGHGAVHLVDHERSLGALLLERCVPGTTLATSATDPDAALEVFASLLNDLVVPPPEGVGTLTAEAADWLNDIRNQWKETGRPCEVRLVDAAVDILGDLGPDAGTGVLVHQDLHASNVLASDRGWLAIDPKPLAGERELSVAPIVRDFDLGHDRRLVRHRLDRLSSDLGLDRLRARDWTVAQTLAWAFRSRFAEQHFQTVRWLLDDPPR